MENKGLTLPDQKNYEYAYKSAYQLVSEKLIRIEDIEQQCRNSDAQYQIVNTQKTVIIRYLNRSYLIILPSIKISLVDSAEEVPNKDKVLILHYFTSAKGTAPAGRLITFRELPEGKVYSPTFSKRTIKPLIDNFGRETNLLVEMSKVLGGRRVDYGDTAITINVFSRVPITFVLWRGDDEFAPQGNVLFDANIIDYLSTEDITVVCEIITWRLIRLLREA